MDRLGLVILCAAGLAAVAAAASPDPATLAVPAAEQKKARALVRKLGSESFPEREEAQEELAKMGRLARPALAEALNTDPNPEVRFRCSRLLPKANAEELQARLDAFLADADGRFEHDLPGWAEFREAAGAEWRMLGYRVWADKGRAGAARSVYVGLIEDATNRALVTAVGGPDDDLGPMVAARKQELYNQRFPRGFVPNAQPRQPTIADVAALLFAESHAPARQVPRAISVSLLFSAPGVTSAVNDAGEKGPVYRAVVARWMDTRADAYDQYSALTVAGNLGLRDAGGRVAARLLGNPTAPATYRGQAAMTLAKLGAVEHLPALEKCLADEALVVRPRPVGAGGPMPGEIQVRDVALVACLMLTDQDPAEYGFAENYRGGLRTSYTNWSIPAEKRAAALERWAGWRKNHPDAGTRKD